MYFEGVNVCVYGLNRSLGVTAHSIEEKILKPLRLIAKETHFRAAFNVTASGEFSSQRSGEGLSLIGDDQQKLLPDFQIQLVDQDAFDNQFNLSDILVHGDHYRDNGGSVQNMMRALHALQRCYESIPRCARESFPTIFVRPDLDIIDDIDIEFLLSHANGDSIIVPGWQFFGGVNDRFAISAAGKASDAYAERFRTVVEYLQLTSRPFHSESYLFDVLNLRRIRILPIVQTRFVRVRAGKSLHPETIQYEHLQPVASAESWSLLTQQLMTMHRRLREAGERIASLKLAQGALEHKVQTLKQTIQDCKRKVKRLRGKVKLLKEQ